jgi:hypothetical protein
MTARQSVFLSVCLVLGSLALVAVLARTGTAQARVEGTAVATGRFQMVTIVPPNERRQTIVVLDSATGQTWIHPADAHRESTWEDLGSPMTPKK